MRAADFPFEKGDTAIYVGNEGTRAEFKELVTVMEIPDGAEIDSVHVLFIEDDSMGYVAPEQLEEAVMDND